MGMQRVAQNIRRYVRDHNTTNEYVFHELGMSKSAFYDRMSGKRPWLLDEAIKLCEIISCTIDELVDGSES